MNHHPREDRPVFFGSRRFRFRKWLIERDIPWMTVLVLAVIAVVSWILVSVLAVVK